MTRQGTQNKRYPIARLLKHFTPKKFKDKKKYNRKNYDWKRIHTQD